jgi:hypothetical protein
MTIKDLGRWESLEMVQRYVRSLISSLLDQEVISPVVNNQARQYGHNSSASSISW